VKRPIQYLILGLLIGLGGTIILFKDLFSVGFQNQLWISNYDTKLMYWIINWGYHILFEAFSPRNFWNANSFFPNLNSLAYSDSLLGLQIFFAPLRISGVAPLTALYLSLGITCILGTVGTSMALEKIGYFGLAESALIVCAAHFCLSMTSFFYHYQLFGFELAPPFFLFLFLYLRDFKREYLFALCFYFCLGASISTYLAPILFTLAVILAPVSLVIRIHEQGLKWIIKQIRVSHLIIVIVFALGLYFLLLRPYILHSAALSTTETQNDLLFSANLVSLIYRISWFSYWYPSQWYRDGAWEYAYFPGYLLLAAVVIGLGWLFFAGARTIWRSWSSKQNSSQSIGPAGYPTKQTQDRHITTEFLIFTSILFVSLIILSLGSQLKWQDSVYSFRMPFYWLSLFLPGLRQVRVPGRIGMLIGLPLGIYLVYIVQNIQLKQLYRNWLTVSLLVLLVIESWPKFSTYPFSADPEGVYQQVRIYNPDRKPLLEMPVASNQSDLDVYEQAMNQLVGSTLHWSPLVVGYGSSLSSQMTRLIYLDRQLQNNQPNLSPIVQFAKKLQITLFLVHLDQYSPQVTGLWEQFIANKSACVLWRNDSAVLFDLDSSSCK